MCLHCEASLDNISKTCWMLGGIFFRSGYYFKFFFLDVWLMPNSRLNTQQGRRPKPYDLLCFGCFSWCDVTPYLVLVGSN